MEVNLAKSAGFCFGVQRAINIALETAESEDQICMLGDIVHNEDVVEQVRKAGIRKIHKLQKGRNNVLLIRAHGAALKTIESAKRLGYKIIDATCPRVKEIHKIAKQMEEQGYRIIVIGDKKHDEVKGIMGQLEKTAILIENVKAIALNSIKKISKACIVVQSTQNMEKVLEIVKTLRGYIPQIKFFNTICKPTRIKQQEIKTMPKENDVMIIIGSRHSANTKRLFQISKSINKHSYWISSKGQIQPDWLKNAKKVGVTAGASTPKSTIQNVVVYLARFG